MRDDMDTSLLIEKLQRIEERLTRIETQLGLPPISSLPKKSVPTQTPPITTPPSATKTSTAKPGNWLGMIAVVCFVLAAGFIIKLSIQSGWLTPVRQIGIAVLFAFSLIGVGIRFLGSDKAYMSLLPASGIIILYLAAFAAQRLYLLILPETASILVGLISLLCIYLYLRIEHDIYPLIAAIGAYLAPVVLGLDV